ncbi:MAG: CBS domain-containing protein [Desulfobacteraceae bacterium]|nr:CBS domain-containing protein [Desulfobacteraceae bacterium]
MALKKKKITAKTIITSHINADFDAIGSMLAAQKLYPDSVIIFPGSQEKNLRDFFISSMSYLFNMAEPKNIDFKDTTRLVLVDTKQKNRLTGVSELLKKNIEIDIYDHHPAMKDDIKGTFEVSMQLGATTTILTSILRRKKINPTADEATVMALGIYEDTGLFTYSSTTEQDLREAAYLLSCGASLNTIVSLVVKEIKAEQVTWLNELLNEMTTHRINGVDIYISTISSSSYITDLASIVQKVVRMEDIDIFFAIVLMGNKISIIARNRIPEVDAGKILSLFGGGGHAYAASAKVDNQTLAQVELMLVERLKKEVKSIQITKKLMSSPAVTVEPDVQCKKANAKMTRYNTNTLLVVNKKTESYKGYITRQIIEKALYHNLADLPVEDYMNSETSTISFNSELAEIETKIIEEKHKILPVIDNGLIKGVITRTDLLDYLVKHNKELKSNEYNLSRKNGAKKRQIENILYQRLDKQTKQLLESAGKIGQDLGYNMFVVGGFVRDLLLNRKTDDIDIVVEGDGIAFAKAFAKKRKCRINTYKKFSTAVIIFPGNLKIDVASARREYYQTPAALPIVEKSSIKLDLARRDFTINTLAISLNPGTFGVLIDFFGASRDLKDKTIRTIHNLSFVEDPTRIFRAIKFANRFGFKIGKVTSNLIKNAIKINSFKNLSGLRVLSELKQIFEEDNPIPAIKTLQKYGLEKILHPKLEITPKTYDLLESVNKTLSWHDLLYVDDEYYRWSLYFMAILHRCPYAVCDKICSTLKIPLKERKTVLEKRYKAENRLELINNTMPLTKVELYWGLIDFKTELILYMMALTDNENVRKAISYFYTHHKSINPVIQGRDLIKIGIPPGPVFTQILKEVLNAKLNGKVKTKKQELAFAKQWAIDNKLID